jgi:SOS response associated peptidase (SRAP)
MSEAELLDALTRSRPIEKQKSNARNSDNASWRRCRTVRLDTAADVHHRMPVALEESAHDAWLDPTLVDPEQVIALIAGNQLAGAIEKYPVSTRVNGSPNDDSSLLDAVRVE